MGAANLRRGDPERAIECTERCLSLNPNDGNAWGILGEALGDSKNHTAAVDAYLQFVRVFSVIGHFPDRPADRHPLFFGVECAFCNTICE